MLLRPFLISLTAICLLAVGTACSTAARPAATDTQPNSTISFGKNGRPHSTSRVGEEYRVVDLLADDIIASLCDATAPERRVIAFRWEDELLDRQAKLQMDGRQRRIIDRYKLALSERLMATQRLTLIAVDRTAVRNEQEESTQFAKRGIDAAQELAPDLLLHGKCTVFIYGAKLQLIIQSSCIDTKTQAVLYTSEWMCTTPRDAIPEFADLTGNRPDDRSPARATAPAAAAPGAQPAQPVAEAQRGYRTVGSGPYVGWAFANHMVRNGQPLIMRSLHVCQVPANMTVEDLRSATDFGWGPNLLPTPLAPDAGVGIKGMYAGGPYGIKVVCGSESDPVIYFHRMQRPDPNPGFLFELRVQGSTDGAAPAQLRPGASEDFVWLGIPR